MHQTDDKSNVINDLQARLRDTTLESAKVSEAPASSVSVSNNPPNQLYSDILKNIELTGVADEKNTSVYDRVKHLITESRNNLQSILQVNTGRPTVRKAAAARFKLILSIPAAIRLIARQNIRCCLCKQVITFPVWYHSVKYSVNHFHYFICYDPASPDAVTAKCYKKDA